MHKTTVYLPASLKAQLAKAARSTGRSEADLIREGIERVSAEAAGPDPRLPLFNSGQADLAERADELLAGFGER